VVQCIIGSWQYIRQTTYRTPWTIRPITDERGASMKCYCNECGAECKTVIRLWDTVVCSDKCVNELSDRMERKAIGRWPITDGQAPTRLSDSNRMGASGVIRRWTPTDRG
jgi:hypothetical protein